MADSTTHLDVISGTTKQREVTFNELMDALSPATVGGRRASVCEGLIWRQYGGRYHDAGAPFYAGQIQLDDDTTNYIVAALDNGVVTHATDDTNWDDADNYARLYLVITADGAVTSYEDHRQIMDWT